MEKQFADSVETLVKTKQPIHLVTVDYESKQYVVTEEARTFLSQITERVGVIAVAGKYRTGKSYLLNRVIINTQTQDGFGVGPTINPCTKGLWLWTEVLETEYQGQTLKVLLIDSEGIGAFDEDENHDTKIFLLALLLSSFFIFNSMGTIDENALNSLSLIVNLSKELQIKSALLEDCDAEEVSKYFPTFLWVVRDFSLRLIDQHENPISSKEYLENALQTQKGSSDSIEQKNRIRRMIKQVFSDRDCFTMVRPVEQEKQLQSLQNMPDSELRPEFVSQVKQLRQKIFKKVKPKVLNSKQVTGVMFLELACAYTRAINEGIVPNIQSAWSYVCQNECTRAIQNAINWYQLQMQPILAKAQELVDSAVLTKAHKSFREQAVVQFKDKAVGSDVYEFEQDLRNGISKAHQAIKTELTRFCEGKAKKFLETDIERIRRGLQEDLYDSMETVLEHVELMKTSFQTSGPKFHGSQNVLSEVCTTIILKAANYLSIAKRQEVNLNLRKLKEKVEYLEEKAVDDKKEFGAVKARLEEQIQTLSTEKSEAVRNEKVLAERLKFVSLEREKTEERLTSLQKQKDSEISEVVDLLKQDLADKTAELRQTEDDHFRRSAEAEKLNALLEQKLKMTDSELADYKTKYHHKDADCKELSKEIIKARKELQLQTNKIYSNETAYNERIAQIQREHQAEISALTEQNPSRADMNKVDLMQKQFELMMNQFKTISQPQKESPRSSTDGELREKLAEYKQKTKTLQSLNTELQQQLVFLTNKSQTFEQQIGSLKAFKTMFRNTAGVICLKCKKDYTRDEFQSHILSCKKQSERFSVIHANRMVVPVKLYLTQAEMREGQVYYTIAVQNKGEASTIERSLTDLTEFFNDLQGQGQKVSRSSLAKVGRIGLQYNLEDIETTFKGDLFEQIQSGFDDIIRVPSLRESQLFIGFFEISRTESNNVSYESSFDTNFSPQPFTDVSASQTRILSQKCPPKKTKTSKHASPQITDFAFENNSKAQMHHLLNEEEDPQSLIDDFEKLSGDRLSENSHDAHRLTQNRPNFRSNSNEVHTALDSGRVKKSPFSIVGLQNVSSSAALTSKGSARYVTANEYDDEVDSQQLAHDLEFEQDGYNSVSQSSRNCKDKASDGTGGIVENTICEEAEEEVVFAPREKREDSGRTKPNRYATQKFAEFE